MNILKQGSVGDTSGKSKEEDENVTAFTTFAGTTGNFLHKDLAVINV